MSIPDFVLAGDIGGTKTLLGLFDVRAVRPRTVVARSFATIEFPDLNAMIATFMREPEVADSSIRSACFGVAGPVIGSTAELTNVPWKIDARAVADRFGY